ncbi:hypothetical protein NQ315_014070 [Exocentrus adspersus]|uniref:Tyr recombinase domain-containing protein n=1 Tax=Exocentrus adspersus TaxID=1586481 RepID=A0AAV8VV94_9CUCU|nr:hypothetical protein NQ315_014070 [Exocentrus adspersus]
MNDNAESFSIPAEIKQEAQEATLRLLPAKSKRVYVKEMVEFDNWRKKRGLGEGAITEEVLLAYFFNVEKTFCCLFNVDEIFYAEINAESIDISKYGKLTSYLKVGSRKYKTKKAKILERNQIEGFLKNAPDVEYLQVKIGNTRCCIDPGSRSDVRDKGSYLYVLIPDTKTNISRSFTVMEEAFSVNAVEMCRKYISLRPKAACRRFFLRYVDGKCTTQHVGINTISKTFSKVPSFLGLPDPESFTGHGMRRSSATLLANAGGDITTVKRHGGWKSTTVAENYIEESLSSKMAIAEKIQVLPNVGEVVGPSSTSETPRRVNLNPGQNNKVVFELNVNIYCLLLLKFIRSFCTFLILLSSYILVEANHAALDNYEEIFFDAVTQHLGRPRQCTGNSKHVFFIVKLKCVFSPA